MTARRTNYRETTYPAAKWQMLVARHFGIPDIEKMHHSGAREHLEGMGIKLLFANTAIVPGSGMVYVAIIDGPDDWTAFVTEAAPAWRQNVNRFQLTMYGREQIESIMQIGGWPGGRITQQDAVFVGAAAIFARQSGQEVRPS